MRDKLKTGSYKGAQGLAEDVRYYGRWMREQAERRIGHLYPKVRVPAEHGGGEATVIAWLWARTVKCSNPACGADMPLVRSFWLSTKKGKQAWIEPLVDRATKTVRFDVRTGEGGPQEPPKIGRGPTFRCLVCGQISSGTHIKSEGVAGQMGATMTAIVAEGHRGRIYLPPSEEHRGVAQEVIADWRPEEKLAHDPRALWTIPYGLVSFGVLIY